MRIVSTAPEKLFLEVNDRPLSCVVVLSTIKHTDTQMGRSTLDVLRQSAREPTPDERALLERLGILADNLAPNWLEGLLVAEMDDGGMGSLYLLPAGIPPGPRLLGSVAAEYEYRDVDGALVSVQLNLDLDGRPFELDSWKISDNPLISRGGLSTRG